MKAVRIRLTQAAVGAFVPRILTEVKANPAANFVLDGFSGSGKSTAAEMIVSQAAAYGVELELIWMDSLYRGWQGLAAGNQLLSELLKQKANLLANGVSIVSPERFISYAAWDWQNQLPGHLQHLDVTKPWFIEGCAAASEATREFVSIEGWLDVKLVTRLQQLQDRDDDYLDWWPAWQAQHEEFIAAQSDAKGTSVI